MKEGREEGREEVREGITKWGKGGRREVDSEEEYYKWVGGGREGEEGLQALFLTNWPKSDSNSHDHPCCQALVSHTSSFSRAFDGGAPRVWDRSIRLCLVRWQQQSRVAEDRHQFRRDIWAATS